jgi:15-cis-phytoene synthase
VTTPALAESYQTCVQVARRTGQNFYYSFLTLPRRLAEDMCVLYAFMRRTDDLADAEELPVGIREVALHQWREHVRAALHGSATSPPLTAPIPSLLDPLGTSTTPLVDRHILTAIVDVVRRYHIPEQYLFDVIDGVESDLEVRRFETFRQLEDYCYHVAGVVGLCCIHIWGFEGTQAERLAIDCGTAFQLTNVLRDLAEDAARGRIYLPQEDLDRFGYSPEELRAGCRNFAFEALMKFEVDRARDYYDRSADLTACLSPPGRRIYTTMRDIYGGLLREIERRRYDVFTQRIRLSGFQKLKSALLAYLRH